MKTPHFIESQKGTLNAVPQPSKAVLVFMSLWFVVVLSLLVGGLLMENRIFPAGSERVTVVGSAVVGEHVEAPGETPVYVSAGSGGDVLPAPVVDSPLHISAGSGGVAPAPAVTSTPAPVVTSTPAPAVTSTPAPVVTPVPAPVVKETPAPMMTFGGDPFTPAVTDSVPPLAVHMDKKNAPAEAPGETPPPAPVVTEALAPVESEALAVDTWVSLCPSTVVLVDALKSAECGVKIMKGLHDIARPWGGLVTYIWIVPAGYPLTNPLDAIAGVTVLMGGK